MVVSRQFDYSKTSKNNLQCQRISQFIVNLGVTIQFGISSLINGSDEMLGFESLRLMMDIMWPISQSHFNVSYLCSLKCNLFIVILV